MSARVEIAPASVPRLPRHIKLRFDEARQKWVLLAPERVMMPDDIALDILQRCDGTASVASIVGALAAKYEAAPAEVERDVIELLQHLADRGVVAA